MDLGLSFGRSIPLGTIKTGFFKPSLRMSLYSLSLVACNKLARSSTCFCKGQRICLKNFFCFSAQGDKVPRGEVTNFACLPDTTNPAAKFTIDQRLWLCTISSLNACLLNKNACL